MEQLIVFLILLSLGYGFGHYAEKRHYSSILKREEMTRGKPMLIASRHLPSDISINKTELVSGNVVISVDYFKRFIATLRNIVGGKVTSFESLLDRARREAVLRMKKEASEIGATYIFNVKYETSSISKGRKDSIGSVEVLAYGTAVTLDENL